MRLVVPFDDILHGRAAVRVLRALALFPTKEFTGREVAREAAVSPSVAVGELDRFLVHGLVRRRSAGRAHLWKLDPSHRIAAKLRELFEFEYRLDQDLRQTLAQGVRRIPGVQRAILFGSMGRGEGTPESDVDLLLIVDSSSRKGPAMEALGPLRRTVLDQFGSRLSPIIYAQQEWRSRKAPSLVRSIEREGRVVWERSP